MALKKLFAEISKVEEQDDGTIKVWGFASSEAVDSDGEVITADAMKAALPDYMKFGAVREMHQPLAAGTAIEASVQEDGKTLFGAHVVDPVAVKKVQSKVYKGFSIGGKVTKSEGNTITGLKLVEVSLVDRPANPEAVFTVVKIEDSTDPIDVLADILNKGEITPERLLELIKADKPAEADPQKQVEPEPEIKKGMWSVQDFAGVLSTLGWIARDAQDESMYEGDESPIPAALRAWLAAGIQIFKDMAAEETAELLAGLKAAAGEVDVLELADKGLDLSKTAPTEDLTKAGKRFSKATKDALGAIHKAAKDACDHLDKLGYNNDDDEDDAGKAAQADLVKAEVAQVAEIAKGVGIQITEGADAADLLKATVAELLTVRKSLADLQAQPEPAKGVKTVVVSKTEDVAGASEPAVAPVKKDDGTVDEVTTLIKAAQAKPISL